MADIELVIKLSEEKYKDIQSHDWKNGERWYDEEWRAIHHGTPLPKGHGRLIDVDEVIKIANKKKDLHGAIWNAPTIIEADKEVITSESPN